MNSADHPTETVKLEPPRIPDHEMIRLIGRGGYGEVWLARSVVGAFRAVKVVSRQAFRQERPYEREFEGLLNFEPLSRSHPGLVQILHVGRSADDRSFYCIMEAADDLASGPHIVPERYQPRTLRAVLEVRTRLPVGECVALGASLASALAYLHRQGLVHRDIKPSNIIFVRGLPKLADVGLVTGLGEKVSFVGTEGYLPPEGPGSASADLFALGKVLYEAGLGKPVGEFPELPTALRQMPEASSLLRLNEIILKLCDPQPRRRYPSAEALVTALWTLQTETQPQPPSPLSPEQRAGLTGFRVTLLHTPGSASDLRLARLVQERLSASGALVHLDEQPAGDLNWARQLEAHVRTSQAVIALLSPTAVADELLAYGLEIARQAASQSGGDPRLLAVRVQFTDPLPRFHALTLAAASVLHWLGTQDDDSLLGAVMETLAHPAIPTPTGAPTA